ncbi:P-protein [Echria macrotheca]|uniref:prephenate dehydratase n=1 Tax=Echria macrotheca TaxID=438768 RepID=A0AAJ0BHR6_9PEZI|nr:P-protein [Echria macrotheca]
MVDVVAFLGPLATYSHQATRLVFPEEEQKQDDETGKDKAEKKKRWELLPTVTIREVFDKVQTGSARYGVVPFENSTHGTVTFTLDGLADRRGTYPDLEVCDEVYLDVHHYLLGRYPPGLGVSNTAGTHKDDRRKTPLVPLDHVKRVYSHPQAFGQTAGFVGRYLGGVETVDVSSTSKAAELAAADATGTSAAIAGEMAGEKEGLDVLAREIEDREDNTTRFFVLRRTGDTGPGSGLRGGGGEGDKRYKSLVSFTVPHRTPGALADVLECFRRGGLNLTSINSLPSLVEPFRYLFFVEFEGSGYDDPEGRVRGVFDSLERTAETWRWLGSWVNRR